MSPVADRFASAKHSVINACQYRFSTTPTSVIQALNQSDQASSPQPDWEVTTTHNEVETANSHATKTKQSDQIPYGARERSNWLGNHAALGVPGSRSDAVFGEPKSTSSVECFRLGQVRDFAEQDTKSDKREAPPQTSHTVSRAFKQAFREHRGLPHNKLLSWRRQE